MVLARHLSKVIMISENKVMDELYRINPDVNYIHNTDVVYLDSIGDLETLLSVFGDDERFELAVIKDERRRYKSKDLGESKSTTR
jgi:hypothetical protein